MAAKLSAARATVVAAAITAIGAIIVAIVAKGDDAKADPVRVAGASLTTTASSFSSRCPLTFRLEGKLDIEGGTGDVIYRWLRSDGFGAPTVPGDRQRVAVNGPGSVPVTDEWTPNVPLGRAARTTTLEVLEPRVLRSTPVLISGICDYRYPPNPPIPPPQVPGGPPG